MRVALTTLRRVVPVSVSSLETMSHDLDLRSPPVPPPRKEVRSERWRTRHAMGLSRPPKLFRRCRRREPADEIGGDGREDEEEEAEEEASDW